MKILQIVIRCEAQPDKHAKILRINTSSEALEIGCMTAKAYVENFARILDGTSPLYIHKPGPDSPIGKCATCGARYTVTVEELEDKDAKSKG